MAAKRKVWVHVLVTPDERQRWQAAAAAEGLTLADLIRRRLATDTVGRNPRRSRRTVPDADPRLLAEIARIGNNLNQIARWANTHKSAADTVQVLAALSALDREISSFLLPHGGLGAKPPAED